MASASPTRRSTLLAGLIGALLLTIGFVAWIASGSPESPGLIATAPSRASRPEAPALESPAAEPVAPPAAVETAAAPALPADAGRTQLGIDGGAPAQFEVLVRTSDQGTPIPGCEVLYFEAGGDVEDELEQLVSRSVFDIEIFRRVARRTLADLNGIARLPVTSESLVAFAISPSHFGSESFDSDPSSTETRTIDCDPMYFVRAQVVDEQERPQVGVPLRLTKKEHGFLDFDVGGTTHGPEGLAELGPIECGDHELSILRVAGAFPANAGIELDPSILPAAPVRLVLPAHGALEVKLVEASGRPFVGTAEVELEALEEGIEPRVQASAWVEIGKGGANFAHVGLNLDLRAKISIPGQERSYEVQGRGPTSAGEKAVLELKLDSGNLTLVARILDVERRPLRFRELRLIGAIESEKQSRQFDQQVRTDAVGNCALTLENCELQGATANLLIVREREALGALKSLALHGGANELGTWTLVPAPLLASGRAVDRHGVDASEATIEVQSPARGLGVVWAEPAQSAEGGKFELRGWSSEPTISLRAVGHGGSQSNPPIAVAKGRTDVLLEQP